jgi:hypothetical protein
MPERDLRDGHLYSEVQDENGVDLPLLRHQLSLSFEERLLELERMLEFAAELQAAPRR